MNVMARQMAEACTFSRVPVGWNWIDTECLLVLYSRLPSSLLKMSSRLVLSFGGKLLDDDEFNSLPQREFVRHIETTLARSLYNCDELYVHGGFQTDDSWQLA